MANPQPPFGCILFPNQPFSSGGMYDPQLYLPCPNPQANCPQPPSGPGVFVHGPFVFSPAGNGLPPPSGNTLYPTPIMPMPPVGGGGFCVIL